MRILPKPGPFHSQFTDSYFSGRQGKGDIYTWPVVGYGSMDPGSGKASTNSLTSAKGSPQNHPRFQTECCNLNQTSVILGSKSEFSRVLL